MNARAYLLAGLSSLALVATPAMAQDAAAEDDGNIIIVTATKRDANLQDIPFSINAQTAEDIQKSGAVTLEDLSRHLHVSPATCNRLLQKSIGRSFKTALIARDPYEQDLRRHMLLVEQYLLCACVEFRRAQQPGPNAPYIQYLFPAAQFDRAGEVGQRQRAPQHVVEVTALRQVERRRHPRLALGRQELTQRRRDLRPSPRAPRRAASRAQPARGRTA